MKIRKPELMAPAGNWTMLNSALNAGADAIYFGLSSLNMRAKAVNFNIEDLQQIVSLCKSKNTSAYLTLNTLIYENEIDEAENIIIAAKNAGVDMIICWDLSVISLCNKHNVNFCISTQASVSNSQSAMMYKTLGAKRIVLARECSLETIKEIKRKTEIEIEVFIHGAMCIAVSGRCFMSHHLFDKSANRGECIQPCRREFEVYDPSIGKSLIIGDDYVLSPKDLCTINFIDQLIEARIDSFKIEGRKRSPEYVSVTVSAYRKAIDLYFEGKLTQEKISELYEELKKVYNRGFSSGFYFDVPSSEEYAGTYGSLATTRKEYIGKIINYYKKSEVAEIKIESGEISVGDELLIIGPTTGVVNVKITHLIFNDIATDSASKGSLITLPCPDLVRKNDAVYNIKEVEVNSKQVKKVKLS